MSHADQSALRLGVLSYPERCISPSIDFHLASGLSNCRTARWRGGSQCAGLKAQVTGQNRIPWSLSTRGRWEFLPYPIDGPHKAKKSVFLPLSIVCSLFPPCLLDSILSHVRLPDYQYLPAFRGIAPRKKKEKETNRMAFVRFGFVS